MITYYNQLVTYLNKHGQINTCLSSTVGTFFKKKKGNHKSGHKVSPNFEWLKSFGESSLVTMK